MIKVANTDTGERTMVVAFPHAEVADLNTQINPSHVHNNTNQTGQWYARGGALHLHV